VSFDPELERLLREAGQALPEPEGESSRRARTRAVAAVRRRRPRRLRLAALLGAVLAVAIALGIGVGALVVPSGEAAKAPVGLGFLPQPGWFALQASGRADPVYQTIAVAANVPFAPEDDVAGQADASGLPYATLLNLPPNGIVIVASFLRLGPQNTVFYPVYDERELPLRLSEAAPYIYGGTQLRPEDPIAQYQLRAAVNGHFVDVQVYFGTPTPSSALQGEAQRQLDGLVVRADPARSTARRPASTQHGAAPGVIDQTFACVPRLVGGIRQIDAGGRQGSGRRGSRWDRPPLASISTTVSGAAATVIEDKLAWVTAGAPSAAATVVETRVGYVFPVRSWGTLAVNAKLCRRTSVRVPLGRRGVRGGATGPFDEQWDCATGRRVLVRVRAVVASRTVLRTFHGFLRTTVPVKSAMLAARTESGKPLAYAEVFESGKTLLFTAPTCFPD
jgi:hypothetical protein